ncbi:MAG: MAPEG family protein [Pseudomonadota bacterium]
MIERLAASSPSIVDIASLDRAYDYFLASIALYGAMIFVQAVAANVSGSTTLKGLLGARDELPVEGVSKFHGRAKRAQANMTESMIMFAPLMIVALIQAEGAQNIEKAALLFVCARVVYAPLYYFGVPVLRTVAWVAGMAAIIWLFVEVWI